MAKLRDCVYTFDASTIRSVLQKFDVSLPDGIGQAALLRFETLSPDAFMWRLRVADSVYYLFAEDYIPSLDYVKNMFNAYLTTNKWSLIRVRHPKAFEEAEPVMGATTYQEPEDVNALMRYAADSGNDFCFLAKSEENADNALFSEDAPHGFDYGSVRTD